MKHTCMFRAFSPRGVSKHKNQDFRRSRAQSFHTQLGPTGHDHNNDLGNQRNCDPPARYLCLDLSWNPFLAYPPPPCKREPPTESHTPRSAQQLWRGRAQGVQEVLLFEGTPPTPASPTQERRCSTMGGGMSYDTRARRPTTQATLFRSLRRIEQPPGRLSRYSKVSTCKAQGDVDDPAAQPQRLRPRIAPHRCECNAGHPAEPPVGQGLAPPARADRLGLDWLRIPRRLSMSLRAKLCLKTPNPIQTHRRPRIRTSCAFPRARCCASGRRRHFCCELYIYIYTSAY